LTTVIAQLSACLSDRLIHFQTTEDWRDWKWQLKNSITDASELDFYDPVGEDEIQGMKLAERRYKMSVTPYYLSLADWNNPLDPIRLQCLPDSREVLYSCEDSSEDPLNEEMHMPIEGLVHKFRDRALVLTTNRCAVYCRHCNRKRYWSQSNRTQTNAIKRLEAIADYISRHHEIREVIFSGGDPLMLSDNMIEMMLGLFKKISHIEVMRIGSRVPVTLPMRITDRLCRILSRFRPLWFNTQFNHPAEITQEAQEACERLQCAGIPVSSQTVLLKGVNDNLETMKILLQGLQRIMVRPYYLFQCEPVKGVDHFRTDIKTGIDIMDNIWGETAGLCIPHLVSDMPEGKKRLVGRACC